MITRPSVEALRAELVGDTGSEPPSPVERLAPGVFLLADDGAPLGSKAALADLAVQTRAWLASNLAPQRFPAVLVHTAASSPIVPQAHLYADGLVNVVRLQRPDLKPDLLVHELTHAFSGIRDEWASELLAYYAGFSGIAGSPSCHARALEAYAIELDDIVRTALSVWDVLTPARTTPGLHYDPTNPYCGFAFMRVFEELVRRAGRAGVFEYLRGVDAEDEGGKPALFTLLFGGTREVVARELCRSLEAKRSARGSSVGPSATLDEALEDLERRWWADGFEIAYLRTALEKWRTESSAHAALYLDYRTYRSQRESGRENEVFRRHLLRRSRDALANGASSPTLAYARYFLLTDYALHAFGGRMARLAAEDRDTFAALKQSVLQLESFPESLLARTALAHFHLFYAEPLGAESARGELLLETVLREDPSWEEAYLHLVASAAASGDTRGRERWLREYRARVPSGHGASLLERITDREANRRVA
jgi:hypothetical protein